MNNKQIVCDGCGFYIDEFFINKHKSGKNYCIHCKDKAPRDSETIKESGFDTALKVAIKTPPLKYKDLKERLKKEKEEKKHKIESKKNSK
jgi:hypothetical protein